MRVTFTNIELDSILEQCRQHGSAEADLMYPHGSSENELARKGLVIRQFLEMTCPVVIQEAYD